MLYLIVRNNKSNKRNYKQSKSKHKRYLTLDIIGYTVSDKRTLITKPIICRHRLKIQSEKETKNGQFLIFSHLESQSIWGEQNIVDKFILDN